MLRPLYARTNTKAVPVSRRTVAVVTWILLLFFFCRSVRAPYFFQPFLFGITSWAKQKQTFAHKQTENTHRIKKKKKKKNIKRKKKSMLILSSIESDSPFSFFFLVFVVNHVPSLWWWRMPNIICRMDAFILSFCLCVFPLRSSRLARATRTMSAICTQPNDVSTR